MNRVNDTERKDIIFLYFFPAKYNGAFSHNCTPQSERTSIPATFIWERKKMGRNVNWHPEKKYTWILWENFKKREKKTVISCMMSIYPSWDCAREWILGTTSSVSACQVLILFITYHTCFITWNSLLPMSFRKELSKIGAFEYISIDICAL